MDGKFRKLTISKENFTSTNGIYCNNENSDILFSIMKEKFGKPNGNSLLEYKSNWKYIFKYQSSYFTVYNYNNFWSVGFLERKEEVPDYEFISVISKMLFNYLNELLNQNKEKLKIAV